MSSFLYLSPEYVAIVRCELSNSFRGCVPLDTLFGVTTKPLGTANSLNLGGNRDACRMQNQFSIDLYLVIILAHIKLQI